MLTNKQITTLRSLADQYETADFIAADPSQFMHAVRGVENQETMAFVAASLSYGARLQFIPKIQYLLNASQHDIYQWVLCRRYETSVPDVDTCFYRLYTFHDYHLFLNALSELLQRYGSLGNFARQCGNDALSVIDAFCAFFATHGASKVIPQDTSSACKRLCMFMRWLVRRNSPVDIGLWTFIDPATLIIPLDTHVLSQAVQLGLLTKATATMKTAIRLTQSLREAFPNDPTKADFALFGYGVKNM